MRLRFDPELPELVNLLESLRIVYFLLDRGSLGEHHTGASVLEIPFNE